MLYFNYVPAVVWPLLLDLPRHVVSHLLIEMTFPFINSTNKLQLKLVLLT